MPQTRPRRARHIKRHGSYHSRMTIPATGTRRRRTACCLRLRSFVPTRIRLGHTHGLRPLGLRGLTSLGLLSAHTGEQYVRVGHCDTGGAAGIQSRERKGGERRVRLWALFGARVATFPLSLAITKPSEDADMGYISVVCRSRGGVTTPARPECRPETEN